MNIKLILELENMKLGYRLKKQATPKKYLEAIENNRNMRSLIKMHWYNTKKKNVPNPSVVKTKQYCNSFLFNGITGRARLIRTRLIRSSS